MTYHSDWSKVSTKEKVTSSLDCLWMLVMKHFNTHNVWPRVISEPLTPKTKLSDNQFYMHCVKQIGAWGNVLIRHVCEWKHRKHSLWACPFSGVEFHGAFHIQKIDIFSSCSRFGIHIISTVIVWMLLAECSESISHNHTAHIKKCPDSIVGKTAKASSLLNLFICHQHRHMAFSITISTHLPLFALNDLVN